MTERKRSRASPWDLTALLNAADPKAVGGIVMIDNVR